MNDAVFRSLEAGAFGFLLKSAAPTDRGSVPLAEATVEAHLSTIQTELGIRNRVEIAVLAERAGLSR